MPTKNNKKADSLLVVAHPDDETLFFAGLLLEKTAWKWHIVCVTDGDADGLGSERHKQFQKACQKLGAVSSEHWDFPDEFEKRLNTVLLQDRIESLVFGTSGKGASAFKRIFTHGPLGEYGHAHHQDVSYATHKAAAFQIPIFSTAYNTFPDMSIALTRKQYEQKTDILWGIYAGEIKRLINLLPATSTEGFVEVHPSEVEALYGWLAQDKPLQEKRVKTYKWLFDYLKEGGGKLSKRIF